MQWQDICDDPQLQDLPYKMELNHWGQIVMSPAKSIHSVLQWEIQRTIYDRLGNNGKIIPECPIQTSDNVKVADVVWISPQRYERVKHEAAYSIAPEVCIEVISASNSKEEMMEKTALYFAAGAMEVWICSIDGILSFYNPSGEISESTMIQDFPKHVDVS